MTKTEVLKERVMKKEASGTVSSKLLLFTILTFFICLDDNSEAEDANSASGDGAGIR